MDSKILNVKAFSRPFDLFHDRYQLYYHEAINRSLTGTGARFTRVSMTRFPLVLEMLWRFRLIIKRLFPNISWTLGIVDKTASILEGQCNSPSSFFSSLVGQYLITTSGNKRYRICIDSADFCRVSSQQLLNWCDIYFKTNYWQQYEYPPKVKPMLNCNPMILGHISKLRSYRCVTKEYDICFIVRVRGGTSWEQGVEHNLRMLEQIAKVKCKKFLMAVLVGNDTKSITKRLDSQLKIPWTTSPISRQKLWEISCRSKVNVLRLGMHYCVPWRTFDMLAMGACIIWDRAPFTVWPTPMKSGENFLDLGLNIGLEKQLAPLGEYEEIPDRIHRLILNDELINRISKNNGTYFDLHASPEKVGDYIIDQKFENS